MSEAEAPPPTRSYMDEPGITWREGRPDFAKVDRKYMAERTMRHAEGSLEKTVENLVKTWEMESSHKPDLKDWRTVDPDKCHIRTNGGRQFSLMEAVEIGNYKTFLWDCPLVDMQNETLESTFTNFKSAFPDGFAWEVLEVFSGPPMVTFSWRHWASFTGQYKGVSPTGEAVELRGMTKVLVNGDLKILDMEVYYDPNPMMVTLMGLSRRGGGGKGTGACPFHG